MGELPSVAADLRRPVPFGPADPSVLADPSPPAGGLPPGRLVGSDTLDLSVAAPPADLAAALPVAAGHAALCLDTVLLRPGGPGTLAAHAEHLVGAHHWSFRRDGVRHPHGVRHPGTVMAPETAVVSGAAVGEPVAGQGRCQTWAAVLPQS
ncbi:DUF4253 domain-containing protein [Kitasatospora sp. NPDC093679]|uniref:DUF4253 domain-containing protein n=1 Tax=Kitasatospora sp. NPDC093679 TaxID=3154983 RepID=UPI003439B87D